MQQQTVIQSDDRIASLQVYKYSNNNIENQFLVFTGDNRIQLYHYKLHLDSKQNGVCTLDKKIAQLDTSARITSMDFAPLSMTSKLLLVTSDNKNAIHFYHGTNHITNSIRDIHNLAINQLCFVRQNEQLRVLTCSDDRTCKLVDVNTQSVDTTWFMPAAATTIDSDKHNLSLILIGMENGILQIRDMRVPNSQNNYESLRTPVQKVSDRLVGPIVQAQIHPTNSDIIGCVAGTEYFIWDRRRAVQPVSRNSAHISGCSAFQWAPITSSNSMFATCGYDQVKIWDLNSNACIKTLQQSVKVNDIAWVSQKMDGNSSVPYISGCVIAHDTRLNFSEVV